MAKLNNENIKNYIFEELDWDNIVCGTSQIKIDVTDGKVILTGTVPSFAVYRAAELDALTSPGVTAVENRLQVSPPPGSDIGDNDIQMRVEKILQWHPELGPKIKVTVKNGIVNLEGSVDAYWKKVKAEDLASDLHGVRGLVNTLTVAPTESIVDQAIGENIVATLKHTGSINVRSLDIEVKDGIVTLSGTIPNAATRRAILNAAKNASGVIDVVDQLKIS
jgi:osmotically-inducible protein OsmY